MLAIIFTLVIVGIVLWAINQYVPMQPTIKNILNIVVVILVLLYLYTALTGQRLPGL